MVKREHPLRAVRRAAGLTQAALGRRLGVHRSRISQIEAGDGTLTGRHWARFFKLFSGQMAAAGVDAVGLLRGERVPVPGQEKGTEA